jgi:hypothetical protein
MANFRIEQHMCISPSTSHVQAGATKKSKKKSKLFQNCREFQDEKTGEIRLYGNAKFKLLYSSPFGNLGGSQKNSAHG